MAALIKLWSVMRIVIEGNLSQAASYGIVNFRLGCSLSEMGHEVSMVGLDLRPDEVAALVASHDIVHLKLKAGEPESAEVRIRQIWPPIWVRRHPGELLVVSQPWEYGSIPLDWIDGIQGVDAIWVPSEYSKRSYIQAGIDPSKVWVVPNGVDTEGVEQAENRDRERKKLLFVGGTIFRKGIDILIEALDTVDNKVLNSLDLVVKESGRDTFYKGQSVLDESLASHPRVRARSSVVSGHLTRRQLLEMMATSDLLVQPYRSEGFGLPVLEAMAIGTPVMHTLGGATNEFCGPAESLLIPSSLMVAEQPKVGNYLLADRYYWLEPSVEQLAQLITSVAVGRDDLDKLASAAKTRAECFTWTRVGKIAQEALVSLQSGEVPQDSLSRLESDLSDAMDGNHARPAPLLSRLVAAGDISSALRLAAYFEGRANPRESVEIASARERLASISAQTPDVWSGGPYRMIVAEAEFQKVGHFGYVHDFEGGDQATYSVALSLSGYLKSCTSVLDLACGQGSMLRVLRSQGKEVQGVEADPTLVSRLVADGFKIQEGYVPSNLDRMDFNSFDGVFLGHIVEHLQPSEMEQLLEWIYDNISDRGTLLIQTPDFSNSAVGLHNFWLDSSHIRPYPVPLLKAMLSKSGFVPLDGGCRSIPDIAPLDIIAVARRIPRKQTSPIQTLPSQKAGLRIGHFGLFNGLSGFSQASKGLLDLAALAATGAEVTQIAVDRSAGGQPETGPVVPLRFSDRIESDVAIIDVPAGWLAEVSPRVRATYRIARTTFEAAPLALQFQRALKPFDEVWCFSHYDAEILIRSGTPSDSVVIVPPGISIPDPTCVKELRNSIARDTFRFLSVFNFEPRKNPEALVKAFSLVAAETPKAELVLKLGGISSEDFEHWLADILGPARLSEVRSRVHVIAGNVPRDSLFALYIQCDTFVLPTRGEGYGLPFLEALAYGLPTICPDVGGHREFCSEDNSLIVRTTETPALESTGVFRESYWREVDLNDLADKMREAASQPSHLASLAERGMSDATHFSEAACKASALGRIIQIAESTKIAASAASDRLSEALSLS